MLIRWNYKLSWTSMFRCCSTRLLLIFSLLSLNVILMEKDLYAKQPKKCRSFFAYEIKSRPLPYTSCNMYCIHWFSIIIILYFMFMFNNTFAIYRHRLQQQATICTKVTDVNWKENNYKISWLQSFNWIRVHVCKIDCIINDSFYIPS